MTKSIFIVCLLALAFCGFEDAQGQTPPQAQTLTIPIQLRGFVHTQYKVSPGNYSFAIINFSGNRSLHFVLEQMPGNSITGAAASTVFTGQADAYTARLLKTATLTTGLYRLSIVEVPVWVCSVEVQ